MMPRDEGAMSESIHSDGLLVSSVEIDSTMPLSDLNSRGSMDMGDGSAFFSLDSKTFIRTNRSFMSYNSRRMRLTEGCGG